MPFLTKGSRPMDSKKRDFCILQILCLQGAMKKLSKNTVAYAKNMLGVKKLKWDNLDDWRSKRSDILIDLAYFKMYVNDLAHENLTLFHAEFFHLFSESIETYLYSADFTERNTTNILIIMEKSQFLEEHLMILMQRIVREEI